MGKSEKAIKEKGNSFKAAPGIYIKALILGSAVALLAGIVFTLLELLGYRN